MIGFLINAALVGLQIASSDAKSSPICRKWGYPIFGYPGCESIYLWNRERAKFISLFNVTLRTKRSKFTSLRGRTLQIIAQEFPPYITFNEKSGKIEGYLWKIWEMVEEEIEFKLVSRSFFAKEIASNVTFYPDYMKGLLQLSEGEADVVLGGAVYSKDLPNVKYSHPYLINWYHLYTKSPSMRPSQIYYLKTFEGKLWSVLMVTIFVLTISVWITNKMWNYFYRNFEPDVSAFSCFIGVVASIINQGFDLKLQSLTGRIQIFTALLFGVILYSVFTGVLVIQLSEVDQVFPCKSIKEIARQRTFNLCIRNTSFVILNFLDDEGESLPEWQGILNGKRCLDITDQENLPKILCEKNIFVLENRVIVDQMIRQKRIHCDVVALKKKYFRGFNMFLMRKNFYAGDIFLTLKKMKSAGILQRLEKEWIQRANIINKNMELSEVSLDHIGFILLMYVILMMISLIILGTEILWKKFKQT